MQYRIMIGLAAALCAGSAVAQDIATKTGRIVAPAAGAGQVVFFRSGTMMGGALGCTVREGTAEVARLGAGKYHAVSVAPGQHAYTTSADSKDVLTLEVEPGETYYVQCKMGAGGLTYKPNLLPSDAAEFTKRAKGLAQWKGGIDKR
ncbi:hypothetical protein [Sphingomonas sp. VNH70]|uniref:hypothetical protein n=1 Tax=Sphingomonas silueang TaxID=3156617 RepID=UPI0032B5AF66